jgi:hypothetical protein
VLLYADLPARRLRQVLADVCGLAWCVLAVLVAQAVHAAISSLAGPGRQLERSGQGLADGLTSAAERMSGVPLVGDDTSAPVQRAADAAQGVADAGRATQDVVAQVATATAVVLVLGAVLVAALVWLLPRAIWVRRAAQTRAVAGRPDGVDLLALQALATGPVGRVHTLGDGVVDGWRRGDPATVERLAAVQLARLGLGPATLRR